MDDFPAVLVRFSTGRVFGVTGEIFFDGPRDDDGHKADEEEGEDHRVDDG